MSKKKKKNDISGKTVFFIILFIVILWFISTEKMLSFVNHYGDDTPINPPNNYSSRTFSLISSSENQVFDQELKEFAKKNKIKIDITYDDTLKITKRLNQGELYDAVWLSNSIWMYAVDTSKVKITDTKSTSINPIVFGIKKSKAEELGFTNRELKTQEIVDAVEQGKLKFSMSNPITTNSGASAYLGILTTLAGNPEVLTSEMLENEELKEKLKTFFTGLERSSGDEDFLEELFLKGDYEAVFTYESSIININKQLKNKKKETLYALYPVDGVSIADSPIGYIDQKDEKKKEQYEVLLEFFTSKKGQDLLASYGRRTWYGGVTDSADPKVFNPEWGIDTTKYISPLKYPSTAVIQKALVLYQEAIRKPVHVIFCLDYSGSMSGRRIEALQDAMDYILTDRAMDEMIQFNDEDIVEVIPFSSQYDQVWSARSEEERNELLSKIKEKTPLGQTALYPATGEALKHLDSEDSSQYNTSVIVMTDGAGNIGTIDELVKVYNKLHHPIPIYSIQFGNASIRQLEAMADISNGKVFDGTIDLVDAFKEVRGYN